MSRIVYLEDSVLCKQRQLGASRLNFYYGYSQHWSMLKKLSESNAASCNQFFGEWTSVTNLLNFPKKQRCLYVLWMTSMLLKKWRRTEHLQMLWWVSSKIYVITDQNKLYAFNKWTVLAMLTVIAGGIKVVIFTFFLCITLLELAIVTVLAAILHLWSRGIVKMHARYSLFYNDAKVCNRCVSVF